MGEINRLVRRGSLLPTQSTPVGLFHLFSGDASRYHPEIIKSPINWDIIQDEIANATAGLAYPKGVIFPEKIAHELLQAGQLHWFLLDIPNQPVLPVVFLGFEQGKESGRSKDAISTVVIDQHQSTRDESIFVSDIYAAGVMHDSTGAARAVSVTYSPYRDTVDQVAFSLKSDRPRMASDPYYLNMEEMYANGGPFTRRMLEAAQHTRLLKFKFDASSLAYTGYYRNFENEQIKFGFDPKDIFLPDESHPWSLTTARQFQEVK